MNYTYYQLLKLMEERGTNLADVSLGRMMDDVEEETGSWPKWDDEAPQWVIDRCVKG